MKARVVATDISLAWRLRIARKQRAGIDARVALVACDLGAAFADESSSTWRSRIRPYIAGRDRASLPSEVRDHEPAVALFGGEDGLAVYRRLIPEAHRLLRPGGWLMMELGEASAAGEMCAGWTGVEIVNDLAGIPRVMVARRP